MDDLVIKRCAERLTDFVRTQSADAVCVCGGVVGEAACEFLSARVAYPDYVSFVELANHFEDADGQQALRARFERRRAPASTT